jgi:4-hydroxy-3-methylbut-2-enyl diphosphate reductase
MKIEIDSNSGFCFGVVYAIQKAESELKKSDKLYCLGDIVHNNVEVKRLQDKGLVTIDYEQYKELRNCKVLIRAHGEPPETYKIAIENNIELIDASCPVVLKLQNKIKTGFDLISDEDGQLIIYGKQGHAEVIGLLGQTNNRGLVISNFEDLDKIDYSKPINLFSQTTKSRTGYADIIEEIKKRMLEKQGNSEINFISNNTICSQVSHRDVQLQSFAENHDVIIFVSGLKSSNGKVLYEVCKSKNEKTYFVSDYGELKKEWFFDAESVGICGATSTPGWLMEKIKEEIIKL